MNLYRVDVEYTVYVTAENDAKAQEIAVGYDVISSATPDLDAQAIADAVEVYSGDAVPDEWMDSIPFGSKNDRTVRECLEAKEMRDA